MSFENKLDRALLVETPLAKVHERIRETVLLEGRTFFITRPDKSDKLLDDPIVRANHELDDYMPYWADLWPGARMLGKFLLKQTWPPGLTALEIGCGLGLPGVVALSLGMRVIFSDYDTTALQFAAANAESNGQFAYSTLPMDWRFPPPDLQASLILASDLIYEMRNVEPLIRFVKQVLTPDGECLLTDQDRIPMNLFRQSLQEAGLPFTMQMIRAGEPGGNRVKGTLYRIRQQA